MAVPLLTELSPLVLLIGATLFAILFAVILTTLSRAQAFPRGASVTLAMCSSLLAVIGIIRTFAHAEETTGSSGSSWMEVILLPYTAMGIAMLLVLLLLLLARLPSRTQEPLRRIRRRFPVAYEEQQRQHEEATEGGEITGEGPPARQAARG
jgi:hypothetical protein